MIRLVIARALAALVIVLVPIPIVGSAACGALLSIGEDGDDDDDDAGSKYDLRDAGDELPTGSGSGEASTALDADVGPSTPEAGSCGTDLRENFESTPGWSPTAPWTLMASAGGAVAERSADGHGTLYGLRLAAPKRSETAVFETPIDHKNTTACTLRFQEWLKLGVGDSKASFVLFELLLLDGRTLGVRVSPNGTVPATGPTANHQLMIYELPSGKQITATPTFKRNEWLDLRVTFEASTGRYRLSFNGNFGAELELASGIPSRARIGLLGAIESGFQEMEESFHDDISVQY